MSLAENLMKGSNYHDNFDPKAIVKCVRCEKEDIGENMCWVDECRIPLCVECRKLWDDTFKPNSKLGVLRKYMNEKPSEQNKKLYSDLWDKTFKQFIKDGEKPFVLS